MVAQSLNIPLDKIGDLAQASRHPAAISSMCVVFAETEIVGLLAAGVPPEDIVAGIQTSVASRVAAMAGRHLDEPVYFTGGVALIPGMAKALEAVLNRPIITVSTPLLTGALGAAILAHKG
jgi:activator of 2-hydroxyglutaryl-CoA dehydratase